MDVTSISECIDYNYVYDLKIGTASTMGLRGLFGFGLDEIKIIQKLIRVSSLVPLLL